MSIGAADLNRMVREILAVVLTFEQEGVGSPMQITGRRKFQEEKRAK